MLPPTSVGKTSPALVFVADWYRIFARLAGVASRSVVNGSGPVPPDGVDTWDAILSVGGIPSPRTMIVHEYDAGKYIAIRSGDHKLIFGDVGISEWIPDVSYPQGCTALLPPINVTQFLEEGRSAPAQDPASLFPSPDYSNGAGVGGKPGPPPGPGSGLKCTEAKPCLFDVENDPTEEHEIAAANPDVVKRLQTELAAYVAGRYTGGLDVATTSEDAYCKLIKEIKWVQPYDDGEFPPPDPPGPPPSPPPPPPPSPPLPPSVAETLAGVWAQNYLGSNRSVEMMRVAVTNATSSTGSVVTIAPLNCTGCCWSEASGPVAADGKSITVTVTTSGPCIKRLTGVVEHAKAGPLGLELVWSQTAGRVAGPGGWSTWVKFSPEG